MFENLSQKLSHIFKKLRSKGKLTTTDVDLTMREIKLTLLEADVNYKVVKNFIERISEKAIGSEVLKSLTPDQQVIKIVNDELSQLLGSGNNECELKFNSKNLTTFMLCGLQGSGKTTHCAKLARYYSKKGHRPLIAACDIYRPAAIEQLKVIGKSAGAFVFSLESTKPVEIALKSLKYASDYGYDLVILDTAGRLHIDDSMMKELKNMKLSFKVDRTFLVVDSMMGQDAVCVAQNFNDQLNIDGIIMTKLDSDTRGGAALSILNITGKPIKFIGTGEKVDDFELFKPDRMASRILGMGDVLTLIEKAKENFKSNDVKTLTNKLKENNFNMNDLLTHMKQIEKMGSLRKIMELIPGISSRMNNFDFDVGESKLVKTKAMISSMTNQERLTPSIINFSRKNRIAKGSGTTVSEVNLLLKQFDQMQKFFKMFNNKKGLFKKNFLSKFK